MVDMGSGCGITFVVPNYNGARFLKQTLESILAQRDPQFRLVVADNCSTDASMEIVQSIRDERVSVVRAARHVSMSENWNRAFDCVATPFAVLAHADDLYDPDYLGVMRPLIEAHPEAFIAHCAVADIDEHGRSIDVPAGRYKARFYPGRDPYCRRPCEEAAWLRKGNYILAPTVIYRMAAIRAIGGFNTALRYAPDWEYWLRGVFAGYDIAGTRRQLVRYRRHAGSESTAAEATLTRYREEIELLQWLARQGFAARCFSDADADYGLVANTLTSEFVERLGRRDRDGARRLAVFARGAIPGFSWSTRDLAMRLASPFGRAGGRALARFRDWYLRC